MQIKRFEAKTMTAALKMVKDEFGVNAVILSARSFRRSRGLFGVGHAAVVEVTAANDTRGPVAPGAMPIVSEPTAWSERSAATDRASRRGLFQSLNDSLRSLAQGRGSNGPRPAPVRPPALLVGLYQRLLSQEVERDLAGDLIEQIQRLPGFDPLIGINGLLAHAARVLHDMGLRGVGQPSESGTPRIVVLAGPSGTGKTTTAIKLAALQSGRSGGKVALLTFDDHRIGAIEQLRIFGSILRVPVAVATSAEMARQAWQAFQSMDWLIVDTPGVSSGEPQRRIELRQMLEPLKNKEVHLVLNASAREKDLLRTIDLWRGFPADCLAFTRLDEVGACGHLLNLLVRTGLPLSYLGTGPRIPEDLADQPLGMLLSRIWPEPVGGATELKVGREPPRAEAPEPESVRLVANGNSELYHRADCKWVRKIKPEHLIHFHTAAEAESRQFVPCRNCRPHRADGHEADAAAWNGVRAAGGR